jgi:hypothetical protein
VDRRRWRASAVLCAQARRLAAVSGIPAESVDDADRVGAALEWATQDPALLECDAALRLAVDTAGQWHWSCSRRLSEMLAACGDLTGAADAYRGLLDQPLLSGPDAGWYVQLMVAAGRVDEAVAVLRSAPLTAGPSPGTCCLP